MKKVFGLVRGSKNGRESQSSPSRLAQRSRSRGSSITSLVSRRGSKTGGSSNDQFEGATKLHLAVWQEDLDRVKKIVAKNDVEVVNAIDARGRTALHLAAFKGHPGLVWSLISHGASVQARDGQGATPLHR